MSPTEQKKDGKISPFISLEKVSKIYKTGEVEIAALHDAGFTVEKGEFCVIVGASGAGKTTLLNILGGMDIATSGKVMVDGTEVSAALRTLDRYFVHIRSVELDAHIYVLLSVSDQLLARTYAVQMAAFTLPDRDRSSPVS